VVSKEVALSIIRVWVSVKLVDGLPLGDCHDGLAPVCCPDMVTCVMQLWHVC